MATVTVDAADLINFSFISSGSGSFDVDPTGFADGVLHTQHTSGPSDFFGSYFLYADIPPAMIPNGAIITEVRAYITAAVQSGAPNGTCSFFTINAGGLNLDPFPCFEGISGAGDSDTDRAFTLTGLSMTKDDFLAWQVFLTWAISYQTGFVSPFDSTIQVDSLRYEIDYTPTTVGITCVDPSTGTMAGGPTATVIGEGFTPTSVVIWDGEELTTTYVDGEHLTVTIPAHALGSIPVAVAETDGSAVELEDAFEYIPFIEIFSIDPNEGTMLGGTFVTITGRGFIPGATITFDGLPATSVTYVDSETYTCITPANTVGPADVRLTQPGYLEPEATGGCGGGGGSFEAQFLRPAEDVSNVGDDGWTPGAGTDCFAVLDETIPAEDEDIISAPLYPSLGSELNTLIMQMTPAVGEVTTAVVDGATSFIRVRAKYTNNGSGTGDAYQNFRTIIGFRRGAEESSFLVLNLVPPEYDAAHGGDFANVLSESWQTFEVSLTDAFYAATEEDWTDIRCFIQNGAGFSFSGDFASTVEISWIEMELNPVP